MNVYKLHFYSVCIFLMTIKFPNSAPSIEINNVTSSEGYENAVEDNNIKCVFESNKIRARIFGSLKEAKSNML